MKLLQKKQQPARRNGNSAREGRASSAELDERYSFRRNRTLTGSLSSSVASAGERHAELRSARVQTHDLRRHRRKLFGLWLVVSLVALVLGFLIFESVALPKAIFSSGVTKPIDAEFYEGKIQDYLNASFLQRSRLTLDTAKLAEYLQTHGCPEVESVSPDMQFAGLGSSTIKLTMRRPAVSWTTGGTQLFVDQHGVAFEKNYYELPGVEVVDQTGIQAVNNRILASNRFLGFVGRTIGKFAEQGYRVTKVVLPENTTRQLLLSLDGVGYPIKVSVDRPAGAQAEDAARSIRYLASRGVNPEYLDVRVSGKAFYK
jgi:hypothetical protein